TPSASSTFCSRVTPVNESTVSRRRASKSSGRYGRMVTVTVVSKPPARVAVLPVGIAPVPLRGSDFSHKGEEIGGGSRGPTSPSWGGPESCDVAGGVPNPLPGRSRSSSVLQHSLLCARVSRLPVGVWDEVVAGPVRPQRHLRVEEVDLPLPVGLPGHSGHLE